MTPSHPGPHPERSERSTLCLLEPVLLEVHQPRHMVPPSKPGNLTEAVLVDPAKQITGYPGVQDTRVARQNVDIEAARHGPNDLVQPSTELQPVCSRSLAALGMRKGGA